MKNPRLRIKKKVRIKAIVKFKRDIDEIVEDCLMDIKHYIKQDILNYLKKQGILYAKNKKKNKKKK